MLGLLPVVKVASVPGQAFKKGVQGATPAPLQILQLIKMTSTSGILLVVGRYVYIFS